MGKRARKTMGQGTVPPAATKKRKGDEDNDAPGADICDDVLDNIFARLPTRTAVASMVLSKHHHRLICSPGFRNLHFRLSPPAPLPHPHIAYVVTTPVKCGHEFVGGFPSFHVAGGGLRSNDAPMRTLADERYIGMKYVNTCNGIVLLTCPTKPPTTCVLWNPAVADDEMKVIIPYTVKRSLNQHGYYPGPGNHMMSVLGLGYGRRTKTYKLLLLLWHKPGLQNFSYHPILAYSNELMVYTLGNVREQPRGVTLLPRTMRTEISQESLYINGTVYLPFDNSEVLAFNVDDEEVTRIDMPTRKCWDFRNQVQSELVQMSDRPCLVKNDCSNIILWLLTEDHLWEQRCAFTVDSYLSYWPIKVVWNCDGALFLYPYNTARRTSKFSIYEAATNQLLLTENQSHHLTPEYALCWGYRPTLVSPGSIVGEVGQDAERRGNCTVDTAEVLKPVNDQDEKNGQTTTLNTIRFMESLIPIMEKLTQDAVQLDSD